MNLKPLIHTSLGLMPQNSWNEMMRNDLVKQDNDLLNNLMCKKETVRDVYSISTLYYEKRKGRNSMDQRSKQPHMIN